MGTIIKRGEINLIIGNYLYENSDDLSRVNLANKIYQDFTTEQKNKVLKNNLFSDVAQVYMDIPIGSRGTLIKTLQKYYGESSKIKVKKDLNESFPLMEEIKCIIDFDYDTYLEKKYTGIVAKVPRNKIQFQSGKIRLYKIFGDISTENTLLLGSQDIKKYRTLDLYNEYKNFLREEFYQRETIIVGLNFSDGDVLDLFQELVNSFDKGRLKQIYYQNISDDEDEGLKIILENLGVIFLKKGAISEIFAENSEVVQEDTYKELENIKNQMQLVPDSFIKDEITLEQKIEVDENLRIESLSPEIEITEEEELFEQKGIPSILFQEKKDFFENNENIFIMEEELQCELEQSKLMEVEENKRIKEERKRTESMRTAQIDLKQPFEAIVNLVENISLVGEQISYIVEPNKEIKTRKKLEVVKVELANELQLAALHQKKNPIMYSNIDYDLERFKVEKLNISSIKIGVHTIKNLRARILKNGRVNFLEIKSMEFDITFSIDISPERFVTKKWNFLSYVIKEDLNPERFKGVIKLLEGLFDGDTLSFESRGYNGNVNFIIESEKVKFQIIKKLIEDYEKLKWIRSVNFSQLTDDYYSIFLLSNIENKEFKCWGNVVLNRKPMNGEIISYTRKYTYNIKELEGRVIIETIEFKDEFKGGDMTSKGILYVGKKAIVTLSICEEGEQ